MKNNEVPKTLKNLFLIHFFVDYLIAIPLFIAPKVFFNLLNIGTFDPLTARIVAAALFGIGGISIYAHKKNKEIYKILLDLKIIWGGTSTFGILITLLQGYNPIGWIIFFIFLAFTLIWVYYRIKLNKK